MIRSQQQIRRGTVLLFAAAVVASVATSAPSVAHSNFDGAWSVSIVTERGECDRGYRYPIAINNGVLVNAGDASFDISGTVAPNGSVAVRIAYGDKSATGHGRLSGNAGTGSWSGGSCAGTWTAERRSS